MLYIWLTLILCTSAVLLQKGGIDLSKFRQHDYKLIPERLEIVRYNEKILKSLTGKMYKYNRTTPAATGSFISNIDLDDDLEIVVQAYKFLSNEYRYFPMRFQVNLCDVLKMNVMGVGNNYKNCGNFSGCPIKKDKLFHFCNLTVDGSYLPPLFPSGRYMMEFQGLFHDQDVALVRGYGSVDRPLA